MLPCVVSSQRQTSIALIFAAIPPGIRHLRLCPTRTAGHDVSCGDFVVGQPKREHYAGTEWSNIRQRVVVRGARSGGAEEQLAPVGQSDIAAIGAQRTVLC